MATAKTRFSASMVTAPEKAQSNRIKPYRVGCGVPPARLGVSPGPAESADVFKVARSAKNRSGDFRAAVNHRHLIRRGIALPQATANGFSEAVRHPRRLGSRRSADGRYALTRFSCDFCRFAKLKAQGLPRGAVLRPIIRDAASFLEGYCAIVCSDSSNSWLSYLASMKTRRRMSRTKSKTDENT